MARWFVLAFGVFVMSVGAYVMVEPLGLKEFADLILTSSGFWFAVGLRVVVGVLLWMSAPASRTPRILRVLGVVFVLGGLLLLGLGLERVREMAEWGAGLDSLALRAVALSAAGLGGFMIWSVWPRRSKA